MIGYVYERIIILCDWVCVGDVEDVIRVCV